MCASVIQFFCGDIFELEILGRNLVFQSLGDTKKNERFYNKNAMFGAICNMVNKPERFVCMRNKVHTSMEIVTSLIILAVYTDRKYAIESISSPVRRNERCKMKEIACRQSDNLFFFLMTE